MIPYDKYKHILNYPRYELGVYDCFSIVRDMLNDVFGVTIPNYARPKHFDQDPLNLVYRILEEDHFVARPVLDTKALQVGDILIFKVMSENPNHVGIYLGNNLFIHQMHESTPIEENLSLKWFRRLSHIYYHRDVDQDVYVLDEVDVLQPMDKVRLYVR